MLEGPVFFRMLFFIIMLAFNKVAKFIVGDDLIMSIRIVLKFEA